MAIDSKIPEIALLKKAVEKAFGKNPGIHSDFVELRDHIFSATKEHISETTLERIWGYSTRGYGSVSRRILDVLCVFIKSRSWEGFVQSLKEKSGAESEIFNRETISSSELQPGARLRIGWPPDRLCIIRYMGDDRYIAEEVMNAKLQPGDTFSSIQFQLTNPNYLSDLRDIEGNLKGMSYGIGLRHGLTTLQLLPSISDE